MNIENLVAWAKEIDRLARLQECRSKRYQELAGMARNAKDGKELMAIQAESRELGRTVVDFGDAIAGLRLALRQRPAKEIKPLSYISK